MAHRALRPTQSAAKALRPYATAAPGLAPRIQTSQLPNGLTIVTEEQPHAQTATVAIWIDAGSRADAPTASGTAHFLEHLAFKGTHKRNKHQLELEAEDKGMLLNAFTSREQTVYYTKSFRKDVPSAVDILADILQNSKFEPSAIEAERGTIIREQQDVDENIEEVCFDHLHAIAYQGHDLGRTILGPRAHILSITREDIVKYVADNYKADRMVLVGAGGVSHDELHKLAEQHLGKLPTSADPMKLGVSTKPQTEFTGSEVRIRDDSKPTCHVAIAVEGVPFNSPDYYPMLVMQSIIGNWDRSLGANSVLSSKFSSIVSEYNLANSFMSFSTNYSDTGLFGCYLVSENVTQLDDLMHFLTKEWRRMSQSPLQGEVERAKSQVRSSLLLGVDGTTAITEDLGRQMITAGRLQDPAEVEAKIQAVSSRDIQDVAQKYLYDRDIAVASVGRVDGLYEVRRPFLFILTQSETVSSTLVFAAGWEHRPGRRRSRFLRQMAKGNETFACDVLELYLVRNKSHIAKPL